MNLPIDTPIEIVLSFLVLVVLLAIIGFLCYPGFAEVRISIADKLKFLFKGGRKSEGEKTKQGGVDIGDGSHVQAEEIIGGDKHETHIHQEAHPKPLPKMELSNEAKKLLKEAVKDPNRIIVKDRSHDVGFTVHTNGVSFVEEKDPHSEALWERAVDQLEGEKLIKDLGEGVIYKVTANGSELAESLAA